MAALCELLLCTCCVPSPMWHPWTCPGDLATTMGARAYREQHGQGVTSAPGATEGRVWVGVCRSDQVAGPTQEETCHLLSAAQESGAQTGTRSQPASGRVDWQTFPPVTNRVRSLWGTQQVDSSLRKIQPVGSHRLPTTGPHFACSCSGTGRGHTLFYLAFGAGLGVCTLPRTHCFKAEAVCCSSSFPW